MKISFFNKDDFFDVFSDLEDSERDCIEEYFDCFDFDS